MNGSTKFEELRKKTDQLQVIDNALDFGIRAAHPVLNSADTWTWSVEKSYSKSEQAHAEASGLMSLLYEITENKLNKLKAKLEHLGKMVELLAATCSTSSEDETAALRHIGGPRASAPVGKVPNKVQPSRRPQVTCMQWPLLFALLASNITAQQSSTGTISGAITDPDGLAVSVPVQVVNTATKIAYNVLASAEGEYSISQLPAGTYRLTVQALATSFRTFTRDDVNVASGQSVKFNIHLEEGIGLNTLGDGREFSQDLARANSAKLVIPAGPTPRMPDGKPDLSGYWSAAGGSFDPGVADFQDWAAERARKRQIDNLRDLPGARCLPNGIVLTVNTGAAERIAQIAGLLVMYSEGQFPRQIFLDGRAHPKDPNPSWLGHSIGHWEADTLVADSIGFNDKPWLDWNGHSHTEMLHVIERYHRPDLGHLELEMTVEDRGALKSPWLIKRTYILDPKEDILESVCTENEKDWPHLVSK